MNNSIIKKTDNKEIETIKELSDKKLNNRDFNIKQLNNTEIWVSEVAAAIGKNPYKNPEEIAFKIWQRMDNKTFNYLCSKYSFKSRINIPSTSTIVDFYKENKESILVANSNIKSVAKHLASSIVSKIKDDKSNNENINNIIIDSKDLNSIIFSGPLVNNPFNTTNNSFNTANNLSPVNYTIVSSSTNPSTINSSSPIETETSDKKVNDKDRSVARDVVNNITNDKNKIIKTNENLKLLEKEIYHRIQTIEGIKSEKKIIDKQEVKTSAVINERNEELFIMKLGNSTLKGRVDGIDRKNKILYEVKSRQNCLFKRVPDYERIPILIYLEMTELPMARHIQTYNGDEISTIIKRDSKWIYHTLKPMLDNFVCFLQDVFCSRELQLRLMNQFLFSNNINKKLNNKLNDVITSDSANELRLMYERMDLKLFVSYKLWLIVVDYFC